MREKSMVYVSYRDADGKTGYRIEDVKPGSHILKPGIFPGAFGKPDLHIVHLTPVIDGQKFTIVSVTEYALTDQKRRAIEQGAAQFYKRRN